MKEKPPLSYPEPSPEVVDLKKVRECREWIRVAEENFFTLNSPLQKLIRQVSHGKLTGGKATIALTGELIEAYEKLSELYQEQLNIDDTTWNAARRSAVG